MFLISYRINPNHAVALSRPAAWTILALSGRYSVQFALEPATLSSEATAAIVFGIQHSAQCRAIVPHEFEYHQGNVSG